MSKQRGHEQHEIEDISYLVDHISNLPDCILHQILSLMPTKEAVKTSILSTRWKNQWASVTNIDFDDELFLSKDVDGKCPPDVTSFVKFVEKVLRVCDTSNMKKFRLSCHYYRDAIQITSWISDAIVHNVQELDLDLDLDHFAVGPSANPKSMFESSSLVSLKIRNCRTRRSFRANPIELPSHFSFPCLKTLYLSYVRFPANDDFTEKLLSGCPVLEELVLIEWMHLKNVVISNSTLKSLTIHDQDQDQDRYLSRRGAYCNRSGCKMEIDAVDLTYFKYNGFLLNEITLKNVSSSLVKACIHIRSPGEGEEEVRGRAIQNEGVKEVTPRAIVLLQQLQNVVSLRLSNLTMTLLVSGCTCFPVFPNLSHLELSMKTEKYTIGAVMDFLSFCPVLQSICFSEGFNHFMHLGENNSICSSIPTCISNRLKTLTVKEFYGYNSEICFLKWVLKTACVLERMNILWSETYAWDLERKIKVEKELEKIERKATASVIKFSCIILKHHPNGHDINTRFSKDVVHGFMHLENNSIWSSVPICIMNFLKTVTLKKFLGFTSEICFLECVLKYACVLERMDILWSKTELQDVKFKIDLRKELGKIERSSTACVIKFS